MKTTTLLLRVSLQFFSFVVLVNRGLFAQPHVVYARIFPQNPTEGTWFYNTNIGEVSLFTKGKWEAKTYAFNFQVDSICACGNVAVLKSKTQSCFYPNGLQREYVRKMWCTKPLSIFEDAHGTLWFLDSTSTCIARTNKKNCPISLTKPIQCRGVDAYCVPQFTPTLPWADCNQLHTWGILDKNAQWLIPPIFDVPFHFQNGFAEVMYYGVKRKINEKGEFVE